MQKSTARKCHGVPLPLHAPASAARKHNLSTIGREFESVSELPIAPALPLQTQELGTSRWQLAEEVKVGKARI
jgi:hypothetical protein